MSREVLIHTEQNGNVKIEAQGFEGGTCLEATSAFESMLSQVVAPREMVGECAAGTDKGERVR